MKFIKHPNFINGYQEAGKKLEDLGARVRNNIVQGQKDFKSGKMPYYGTINPFK